MVFPPSMTLVNVTGTFRDMTKDAPAVGKVVFIWSKLVKGPIDHQILTPFKVEKVLDNLGAFSVSLPATNDPDWSPHGKYTVQITINGRTDTGYLLVSHDVASLDLSVGLETAAPAPGVSYILLSQRGAPNGVASLDVDGFVPQSQLSSAPVKVLDTNETIPPETLPGTVIFKVS